MTRRVLLILGLLLLAFDVARLEITGIALAGAVLMALAAYLYGIFTPGFWIASDEESARLDAMDAETRP